MTNMKQANIQQNALHHLNMEQIIQEISYAKFTKSEKHIRIYLWISLIATGLSVILTYLTFLR